MKNKVELIGESFKNLGENWVKAIFNLEYNFDLHNVQDIIRYLNNSELNYRNWELENVGHEYKAILLRGISGIDNIHYLKMEVE